ncbi:MAG: NADH-quinone oxidoreductase subunit C/D [Chloroflexi bacterium]|nr:NADH-quinone oxidoreductase subunit C/D [Chloroflexota bacterium]
MISEIKERFPSIGLTEQLTKDGIATLWVDREHVRQVLSYLKPSYPMLFDITAIDERARRSPADQPKSDFTIVYQLLSFERNSDIRLKVPLVGEYPSISTITDIWPNANWYEREIWDMFGIKIEGHPCPRRLLMPPDWVGHPLRKEHPARATEMEGYTLPEGKEEDEERELKIHPESYGLARSGEDVDYMFLNFGPHHPGTHGLLRIILQLDGEYIVDSVMDIGWHHRGAEKMAERQTFHTYIPYTDRVDYLAGLLNNMPYVLSVEALADIDVPPRAQVIRVMLSELWRIANHLVWFGTFGADVGALSPVFFTFNDRERIFDIMEAICGFRMHPAWFRIGGVVAELPNGWKGMIDDFIKYFPPRIEEYDKMIARNSIFRQRTKGVGAYTVESATEWGVTGPNLRAAGLDWDLRKRRPYSSYDQFDFEIPTATEGDAYARCVVRLEEMRQSLRIVEQAANNMPEGPYKSSSRYAMPPAKEETMLAIETLINHFESVSWGQPIPAGEAMIPTEGAKGNYGYYVISDGSNYAYRCHIRTASFPHLQTLPMLTRGLLVSDLIAILGSLDYVLADVDR